MITNLCTLICAENEYRKLVKVKQPRTLFMPNNVFCPMEPMGAFRKYVEPMMLRGIPSGAVTSAAFTLQYRAQLADLREGPGFVDPAAQAHSIFLKCRAAAYTEATEEDNNNDSGSEGRGPTNAEAGEPLGSPTKVRRAESADTMNDSIASAGTKRKRAPSTGATRGRPKKAGAPGTPSEARPGPTSPEDLFDKAPPFTFERFWPAAVIAKLRANNVAAPAPAASSQFSPTQRAKSNPER
jgi:hypothetical protein